MAAPDTLLNDIKAHGGSEMLRSNHDCDKRALGAGERNAKLAEVTEEAEVSQTEKCLQGSGKNNNNCIRFAHPQMTYSLSVRGALQVMRVGPRGAALTVGVVSCVFVCVCVAHSARVKRHQRLTQEEMYQIWNIGTAGRQGC